MSRYEHSRLIKAQHTASGCSKAFQLNRDFHQAVIGKTLRNIRGMERVPPFRGSLWNTTTTTPFLQRVTWSRSLVMGWGRQTHPNIRKGKQLPGYSSVTMCKRILLFSLTVVTLIKFLYWYFNFLYIHTHFYSELDTKQNEHFHLQTKRGLYL